MCPAIGQLNGDVITPVFDTVIASITIDLQNAVKALQYLNRMLARTTWRIPFLDIAAQCIVGQWVKATPSGANPPHGLSSRARAQRYPFGVKSLVDCFRSAFKHS
jgi:hypothetical protein